tara:strand:+ start:1351 stop:1473 length:123 start_codon:yes stop_codon:yes gene_type:complete
MELDFEFYGFLRRPLRRLLRLIICRAEEKLPIAELYEKKI